jgi:DNA-binding LytR/AlgR family response regulator
MITCLIVEDEPLAADILQDYVRQIPFLVSKGVCTDAIFALDILHKEKIDLLFLDIHLPGLKGLDFLRSLSEPPKVILTTGYHEYAIQGYELNIVDYLLKPIEFSRFLVAVNKVKSAGGVARSLRDTITVQSDKKKVVIPIDEILFIEGQKEYIKIQTTTGQHVTKYGLTKIEEELDMSLFMRVHRSFIISLSKVRSFSSHEIDVGKVVPIGGNFKDSVSQILANYFNSK